MPIRLATTRTALAALCAVTAAAPGPARGAAPAAFITPSYSTRGHLVLDGVPPAPETIGARLGVYLAARAARFIDWLPDGGMLVATRFGETEQLHRVLRPLGSREQLTFLAVPVNDASVPGLRSTADFAFLAPEEDGGAPQIYDYRLSDHAVRPLSDGSGGYADLRWSRDGRQLAYRRSGAADADGDVWITEPAGSAPPRLLVAGGELRLEPLDWSLDDRQLLLRGQRAGSATELFLADVASGALTALGAPAAEAAPAAAPGGVGPAKFSPDGRGVYVVSDAGSEFRQLRELDLASHEWRTVTDTVPWDITSFDLSADGRYLAYVANVDGESRLSVLDNVARTDLALPPLPAGTLGRIAFDPAGRHLAFTLDTGAAPADVYAYDLEHGLLERWTMSEPGAVDPAGFAGPALTRYPSFDRVEGRARAVPAFIYRPSTAGRHPVLISLHGGPDAQYRPQFDPFLQYLVHELGFIVVCPNVRGSSGYGRGYRGLDDGVLREDAVRDVGALIIWLGLQPDVERTRIFVSGEDYGGYLALEALAAYGDRLRGGIAVAGISDLVTYLEHSPAGELGRRRAEFGDEREPRTRAYLERISPLTRSAAMVSPLLVVQGLGPSRVPASESEQMVGSLRGRGAEVWYLHTDDDGGAPRREDQRFSLVTEAAFLEQLLRR
jgi:dipeptidyl aminopeptidase/acylaminoacyl peptidase